VESPCYYQAVGPVLQGLTHTDSPSPLLLLPTSPTSLTALYGRVEGGGARKTTSSSHLVLSFRFLSRERVKVEPFDFLIFIRISPSAPPHALSAASMLSGARSHPPLPSFLQRSPLPMSSCATALRPSSGRPPTSAGIASTYCHSTRTPSSVRVTPSGPAPWPHYCRASSIQSTVFVCADVAREKGKGG